MNFQLKKPSAVLKRRSIVDEEQSGESILKPKQLNSDLLQKDEPKNVDPR